MVALPLHADAPPLRTDADGALRIGTSRVLLEIIVHAFEDGATPEALVQQYPSTTLADVYAVIAYYLRHPAEVEKYLAEREIAGGDMRREAAVRGDLAGLRDRLRVARASR